MAAARNDEGDALLAQAAGHRPHVLALQIDVEDGEVEPALLNFGHGRVDAVAAC
jgi:hypothetical protein